MVDKAGPMNCSTRRISKLRSGDQEEEDVQPMAEAKQGIRPLSLCKFYEIEKDLVVT